MATVCGVVNYPGVTSLIVEHQPPGLEVCLRMASLRRPNGTQGQVKISDRAQRIESSEPCI